MGNTKLKNLWEDIVEAVRGTDRDFTDVKLSRAILLLAIPMVLEMLMESIFAVVDIFFVSKVGSDAVAAVGITESVLTIVYSVGGGLGVATTAMVARRIGEKNAKGASTAAVQAIFAGLGVSLVISVPGVFFAKGLLRLMGASTGVVETGYMYTAIIIGSNGLIMLLFIINSIFRSSGDAAISMRVLWLANIINIILDPCLIFGFGPFPELGIKGAAIATALGRGLAVLYQFTLLFKGRGRVKINIKQFKINFKVMKRLISLSLGGIGQSLIATSSWIGLVRIIAVFGSEVLAGYTIAIRMIVFSLLPSWGLSNAASTLVGQNLGAKKPGRAERAVWVTGFSNMVFLGIIAVIFILFPEPLVRIFIKEAGVVTSGAGCLRFISYGYLFYAFGMVIVQGFNGAGDTATPMKINFFCFWLLEIPLAWVLALPMGLKEKGVYVAIVIAESVLTTVGILIFRRGKWKQREV
ncbi:MAG: MATE family efflux transporter [Candidatus Aminicenantes bacterium]|nr:MAG: MATE family efflux transporter [Candidatus Aminicenantes bacterium]